MYEGTLSHSQSRKMNFLIGLHKNIGRPAFFLQLLHPNEKAVEAGFYRPAVSAVAQLTVSEALKGT